MLHVVPGAGGNGLQPADVAVVVGAEQIDLLLEPAVLLRQVVRSVCGEVRGLTVGPDEDTVLVVAEVGGAQPDGTLEVEDVSLLPQAVHRLHHRSALVQGGLGEEHVEVHPEVGQGLLDVGHLRSIGQFPDDRQRLIIIHVRQLRPGSQSLAAKIGDVLPRIAALRDRSTLDGGQDGGGEGVHLRSGVIDVVLRRHRRAAGAQHTGDRVAQCGPAGVGQMQGPGGIGRDELHVDGVARQGVIGAVGGPCLDDGAGELARRAGVQGDVEEARAGHVDALDAVDAGQPIAEDPGELARIHPRLLAQLQGDVRGPVTVLPVLRPLHTHLCREVDMEVTGLDGGLYTSGNGGG